MTDRPAKNEDSAPDSNDGEPLIVDEFLVTRHMPQVGIPFVSVLPASARDDDAETEWKMISSSVGNGVSLLWQRSVSVEPGELEDAFQVEAGRAVDGGRMAVATPLPASSAATPLPPQPGYASVRAYGTIGGHSVRERGTPGVARAPQSNGFADVEVRPYPGTPPPYEVGGVIHGGGEEPQAEPASVRAPAAGQFGGVVYRPRSDARSTAGRGVRRHGAPR